MQINKYLINIISSYLCFISLAKADLPRVPSYSCILTRTDKAETAEIKLARNMDKEVKFSGGFLRVRTFEKDGFEGYFFYMTFVPIKETLFNVENIKASGFQTSAHTDNGRGLVLSIEHESPPYYLIDFIIQNNRAQMICEQE